MAVKKVSNQMITDAFTIGWNHGYDGMKDLPTYLKNAPARLVKAYNEGHLVGEMDRASKAVAV